jgi:drug/metabolite transporter (DMT)-like permease
MDAMGPGPTADPRLAARWQLFASGALFGLMAALARLGSRDAAGFSGAQLATVRFAVGIALIVGMFRLRPGTFRPVRHRLLVTRGLLGGLAVLLYFAALARMPAAEATLLNGTFPLFATALSFWTLRERPTLPLLAALAAVFLGVLLVLWPSGGTVRMGAGPLLAIAAAVTAGVSVTSIRALRATDNAPTIYLWAMAILDERLSLAGAGGILLGAAGVAWGTAVGSRGAGKVHFAPQGSSSADERLRSASWPPLTAAGPPCEVGVRIRTAKRTTDPEGPAWRRPHP